jgi:hypothetical protein
MMVSVITNSFILFMFMKYVQLKPAHMICQAVVRQWFQQQPKFLAERNHQMVCQWDACMNAHGDYF